MMRRIKNNIHLLNAFIAALYYGFPVKKLTVIGVTGTDGKTTTAHLIHTILKNAGKRVSMISSVYGLIGGKEYDTGFHVTTPSSWFLQKCMRDAVNSSDNYFVLEVTSHGLDQNRTWGIPFELGIITNITHEHLDYHETYEKYVQAKIKLLERSKIAIINSEDESYKTIINKEKLTGNVKNQCKQIVTFGLKTGNITLKIFPFTTGLPGDYNQLNCLAAIAACRSLGVSESIIRNSIKKFSGVTGRFEVINTPEGFDIIIDFAHTPNALNRVLETIHSMTKGQIIHIFGCAGLRDHLKRAMMGAISARYADITIVTEEDYRSEDVNTIINQIAEGYIQEIKDQGSKIKDKKLLLKIPDRQNAIKKAIELAKKGDIVILTGKGHEKSLCRGTIEIPWSEHEAVKKALLSLGNA